MPCGIASSPEGGAFVKKMLFPVAAPPVKMCLSRPAGRDKHEI